MYWTNNKHTSRTDDEMHEFTSCQKNNTAKSARHVSRCMLVRMQKPRNMTGLSFSSCFSSFSFSFAFSFSFSFLPTCVSFSFLISISFSFLLISFFCSFSSSSSPSSTSTYPWGISSSDESSFFLAWDSHRTWQPNLPNTKNDLKHAQRCTWGLQVAI